MITFRRAHLDDFLISHATAFRGDVLDIGGKKNNTRSRFTPPLETVQSWTVINIDAAVQPDITASADNIPLKDQSADTILMTELLEHVPNPEAVLKESARLLKSGGQAYITMPFLNQVHADPHDYTRWTADHLREKITQSGLIVESLTPMGSTYAVIWDLLRAHLYRSHGVGCLSFRIKLKILLLCAPLFRWFDFKDHASRPFITTGWAVIARKP